MYGKSVKEHLSSKDAAKVQHFTSDSKFYRGINGGMYQFVYGNYSWSVTIHKLMAKHLKNKLYFMTQKR